MPSRRNTWLLFSSLIVAALLQALLLVAKLTGLVDHGHIRTTAVLAAAFVPPLIVLCQGVIFTGSALLSKGSRQGRKGELRSRWSVVPVVVVSALACAHFLLAFFFWTFAATSGLLVDAQEWSQGGLQASLRASWYAFSHGWPSFVLLGTSFAAFVAGCNRRRVSVALIVLTLVVGAGAFWYDISNDRWQMHVHTPDWESYYVYFNWPGY